MVAANGSRFSVGLPPQARTGSRRQFLYSHAAYWQRSYVSRSGSGIGLSGSGGKILDDSTTMA